MIQNAAAADAILDGIRWAFGVAGLIASVPATRAILSISREWGERGEMQRRTASAVQALAEQADSSERASRGTLEQIVQRLDRNEFILTGDDGVNGLRGDVKLARAEVQEVRNTLFEQNTAMHTTLGELGLWRERIGGRVEAVEQRLGVRRTKSPGRRKSD